jgi:hypothetical protein
MELNKMSIEELNELKQKLISNNEWNTQLFDDVMELINNNFRQLQHKKIEEKEKKENEKKQKFIEKLKELKSDDVIKTINNNFKIKKLKNNLFCLYQNNKIILKNVEAKTIYNNI